MDKRIFPYVLAVGTLLSLTCKKHRDTVSQQAVVTGIRHAIVYLDTNNDGKSDKTACLVEGDSDIDIIRNNIKAGDTLKFRIDKEDLDKQHRVILLNRLDSVNNMSRDSFLASCNAKELQRKSTKSLDDPMVLDYVLIGDTIEVFLRKQEMNNEQQVNNINYQNNQVVTQVRRLQNQKIK